MLVLGTIEISSWGNRGRFSGYSRLVPAVIEGCFSGNLPKTLTVLPPLSAEAVVSAAPAADSNQSEPLSLLALFSISRLWSSYSENLRCKKQTVQKKQTSGAAKTSSQQLQQHQLIPNKALDSNDSCSMYLCFDLSS